MKAILPTDKEVFLGKATFLSPLPYTQCTLSSDTLYLAKQFQNWVLPSSLRPVPSAKTSLISSI